MPRINLCNLCDLDTDVTAATLQEIVTCLHEYYFDLFEEFDPRYLNIITGVKQITPTLYEMYIKDSYDNGRVESMLYRIEHPLREIGCEASVKNKLQCVFNNKIDGFRYKHENDILISTIISRDGAFLYFTWQCKNTDKIKYTFIKIEHFLSRLTV